MMSPRGLRQVALLALLATAGAAQAQPTRTALTWGVLPVGSRVAAITRLDLQATIRRSDGERLSTKLIARDSSTWAVEAVAADRVLRYDALTERADTRVTVDTGGVAPVTGSMPATDGTRMRLERRGGRWWYDTVSGPAMRETLPPDSSAAQDVLYLDRVAAPGDAWTLGPDELGAAYGPLLAGRPARATVRLDSVGTHGGHAVAYLSYETETTRDEGGGSWVHLRERGTAVRRPDIGLDIRVRLVRDTDEVYRRADGFWSKSTSHRVTEQRLTPLAR